MLTILSILVFILGLIVGSFVNVIGLRYNSGLSFVSGRSKCFNCNTSLKWYDMVPVLSFVFLRGKCRTCKSEISIQYPFVEIFTGLVFVLIALRQISLWPMYSVLDYGLYLSILYAIYYVIVFGILIVTAIYDLNHKIIPNKLVYTFILLSALRFFVFAYCKHWVLGAVDILDLLTPVLLFIPFASMWYFSSGRWMGFGDAKLVFGIGMFTGFVSGVGAVVLAFWIGAIWAIFALVYERLSKNTNSLKMHSEVPFAPFLILAMIVVFFSGIDVLGLDSLVGLIK